MRKFLTGLVILAACSSPAATGGDASVTADGVVSDVGVVDAAVDGTATADAGADVPPPQCPSLTSAVTEGLEVVPQTTLHLLCDAQNGVHVTARAWQVQAPAGATETPQLTLSRNVFTLATSQIGDYTLCATVTYDDGAKNCAAPCLQVHVLTEDLAHAELTWNTPADKDQSDTGPCAGADLDLHVAENLATKLPDQDCDGAPDLWYDMTADCFWGNPAPKWSLADPQALGDPKLDLDDTDGAGPENVNLGWAPNPGPMAYEIAVHAYADCGFGPSVPKVRVYMFGALLFESEGSVAGNADGMLHTLDLWTVAKLTADGTVTACYQSGDACSGKGKMWQAKGDSCVTHCYHPPSGLAGKKPEAPSSCP